MLTPLSGAPVLSTSVPRSSTGCPASARRAGGGGMVTLVARPSMSYVVAVPAVCSRSASMANSLPSQPRPVITKPAPSPRWRSTMSARVPSGTGSSAASSAPPSTPSATGAWAYMSHLLQL